MKEKYVLVIIVLLFACFPVTADEITIVSCDWKPYAGQDLPGYGFTSEIIAKALENVGHKATFKFLPWKRVMYTVKAGKYDAAYSAYYSDERAKNFALTEPYANSKLVLISKKGKNIKYSKLNDLSSYSIGVVRGYVNTPEFDNADYLKKIEATDDLASIRMLFRERMDLIVMDKFVAIYNLKNSPTLEGDFSDVEFLKPPLKIQPIYCMFSRAKPGFEKKIADFNKGLKAITEDGTVKAIMKKSGFFIE